jgi:hypothetical protein
VGHATATAFKRESEKVSNFIHYSAKRNRSIVSRTIQYVCNAGSPINFKKRVALFDRRRSTFRARLCAPRCSIENTTKTQRQSSITMISDRGDGWEVCRRGFAFLASREFFATAAFVLTIVFPIGLVANAVAFGAAHGAVAPIRTVDAEEESEIFDGTFELLERAAVGPSVVERRWPSWLNALWWRISSVVFLVGKLFDRAPETDSVPCRAPSRVATLRCFLWTGPAAVLRFRANRSFRCFTSSWCFLECRITFQ